VKAVRIGLGIVGVLVIVVGGLVLLDLVDPSKYLGLAIWFVGALIIHDGIVALGVFGVSVILRRRLRGGTLAIIQGALVIAALFTAIVVPEILKKNIGTANPTLLPLDYGLNLAVFYGVLVVVTVVVLVVHARFGGRARREPVAR
jgi:hypothetical protein